MIMWGYSDEPEARRTIALSKSANTIKVFQKEAKPADYVDQHHLGHPGERLVHRGIDATHDRVAALLRLDHDRTLQRTGAQRLLERRMPLLQCRRARRRLRQHRLDAECPAQCQPTCQRCGCGAQPAAVGRCAVTSGWRGQGVRCRRVGHSGHERRVPDRF
jgi:hypothetical protein